MGLVNAISSIARRQDCALILVFRRPRIQHGKRRLAATTGERLALEFGHLALNCALEDLRAWRGQVIVAPEHPEDIGWAKDLLLAQPTAGKRPKFLAQGPGNLGRRLERLDRKLSGMRFGRRIYIGSDAPALGPRQYRRVVAGLGTHDVVLPSARDGGVTMMATRRVWPRLAAMPWGAPGLADALSAACRKLGYGVLRYPGGFDVDRASDLARLHRALGDDRRPARRKLLEWLERNGLAG